MNENNGLKDLDKGIKFSERKIKNKHSQEIFDCINNIYRRNYEVL